MSKSFTHAGVSKQDGQFKVRFANDALRTKVLIKNGHTDIDIIELKHPMTKEDAVAYLMEIDFATTNGVTNADVLAALAAEIDKRSEAPAKEPKAKVEKVAKVKAVKSKPTMDAIKAKASAKVKAEKKAVSFAEAEAAVGPAPDMATEDEPY
jgi:hypothetical protein